MRRSLLPAVVLAVGLASPALADVIACDAGGNLYRIDLDSGRAHPLGTVSVRDHRGRKEQVVLTDLASTPDGTVYGTSFSELFEVDPEDPARSRRIGALGVTDMNALAAGPDGLYGGGRQSGVYRIDPGTGRATRIASWPQGGSSGDLALVGDELYATLWAPDGTGDLLARVDPAAGTVTAVARICEGRDGPCSEVFGLATDGTQLLTLYGLDAQGRLLAIDPQSGVAIQVGERARASFWGASRFEVLR